MCKKIVIFTDIMNAQVEKFLSEYYRNIKSFTTFDLAQTYYYLGTVGRSEEPCVQSSEENPYSDIPVVNVSKLVQGV